MAERSHDDIAELVQQSLDQGPFSLQQLAHESGVSYDSLYSWAKRRRAPRAENLRQLADGFESRADVLKRIAADLRRAADSMG